MHVSNCLLIKEGWLIEIGLFMFILDTKFYACRGRSEDGWPFITSEPRKANSHWWFELLEIIALEYTIMCLYAIVYLWLSVHSYYHSQYY